MIKTLKTISLSALFAIVFMAMPFTQARLGGEEIVAMTRALNYVRALDSNNNNIIDIAVLYDPNDQDSLTEARYAQDSFSKNAKLRSGTISAKIVSTQDLRNNLDVDAYFITAGTDSYYEAIRKAAKDNHIFTLSANLACAEENCCALAFVYTHSIQIYLNEAVLNEIGFDIDSNFRYLAKRI